MVLKLVMVTVHLTVIFFSMSALYEASYLSKMQVCLFLLMCQRKQATQPGNCSLFCTEFLLGSSCPVKDYISKSPLLPPYPCILVGLSDSSLWHVSNPFQNEISNIRYSVFLKLVCSLGSWILSIQQGNLRMLENSGTTRGRKGSVGQHWGESHPIKLHLIFVSKIMFSFWDLYLLSHILSSLLHVDINCWQTSLRRTTYTEVLDLPTRFAS